MRKLALVYIAAVGLALAGCETLTAVLKNPEQIEAIYSAAVEGSYEVDVKKDGVLLYKEHWVCLNEGKLQCKRQS